MILQNLDLFYDIYDTINGQTHYLSSILYYFNIYFQVNQKNFLQLYFFIASSVIMISMLSLFEEWITYSVSLSMEKIKLSAIVKWISHVSGFLRLVMMSFKYGLTLIRYSSTDNDLFLSQLICIQYDC